MPYDYSLESENEQRMFTKETLEEMQQYISNVPHYQLDEKFYVVFENNSRRDASIPRILSKIAEKKNIYTHSSISFSPTSIIISIIGDNDVDRQLYDFVVWCQKRYPSSLYSESGKLVPPEDLLDDEEEIPLIG